MPKSVLVNEAFPERLKAFRKARKLSLRTAAEKSGLSVSTFTNLESGRSRLSAFVLSTLALFYGVSEEELAKGSAA